MMKAVNTAGTLISLRNWSTESIPVIPQRQSAQSGPHLLHPVRGQLIGRQKLVGNGGPTHRQERQNCNHA